MIKKEQVDNSNDKYTIEKLAHKKNIVIGFVLYHPSDIQIKRIKNASALGFEVYVFDNSPIHTTEKGFQFNELRYFTYGKNVGLGRGIATICAEAFFDNHTALLFF